MPESITQTQIVACNVCHHPSLTTLADLPGFPVTGLHSRHTDPSREWRADQRVLWCPSCGHVQLGTHLDPNVLFGPSYGFRTFGSSIGRVGRDRFFQFATSLLPTAVDTILEVGCNDLGLLKLFSGRASSLIGIDPVWRGGKDNWFGIPAVDAAGDQKIRVIGELVEDSLDGLNARPDVILFRETLEFLRDPRTALERLLAAAAEDAIVVVEVADFDALVARYRFDRLTHHEPNYFSEKSLRRLITELRCEVIGWEQDNLGRGMIRAAFRKGRPVSVATPARDFSERFQTRLAVFKNHLTRIHETLALMPAPRYGYGGGNLLPALYYFFGEPPGLDAILEDDKEKDGIFYVNIPTPITYAGSIGSLMDATVLVTATNYQRQIAARLADLNPRAILLPLPIC